MLGHKHLLVYIVWTRCQAKLDIAPFWCKGSVHGSLYMVIPYKNILEFEYKEKYILQDIESIADMLSHIYLGNKYRTT